MISKQKVQHIAKLARLGINKKEEVKFARELSLILDYFEKLKEVDVEKVEPTFHPVLLENVMREDIEISNVKYQKSKRLLDLAPETKKGYLKVKSIF